MTTQALTAAGAAATCAIAAIPVTRWINHNSWRRPDESGATVLPLAPVIAAQAATGAVIGASLGTAPWWPAAVAALILAAASTVFVVVDIAVHRIPDAVALPAYIGAGIALLIGSLATGQWAPSIRAALAAAVVAVVLSAVSILTGGGLGLGDIKLLTGWALPLGWVSWAAVYAGVTAAFLAGAIGALIGRRRRGPSTGFAFAPGITIGVLVGIALLPLLDTDMASSPAATRHGHVVRASSYAGITTVR